MGASPQALEVKRRARLAAGRDMPVLPLGETGTGKEVLALAIHAVSPRADKPFVGVNVAAVPENLLEAEFFGVAPGAYTGADRRTREGKFQLANGGTLFLGEVGDMPLPLQAKLLRALQEGEIEALGSNTVTTVDVRVIAATSRNLEAMIAEGSFRSDLYYRLNVLEINIPPLRDRLADLGVLCEALLGEICEGQDMRGEITDAGVAALGSYDWPGNIRELQNVMERASILSTTDTITVQSLNFQAEPKGSIPTTDGKLPSGDYLALTERSISAMEKQLIKKVLDEVLWRRSKAARILGINRTTLYNKIKEYGLEPPEGQKKEES